MVKNMEISTWLVVYFTQYSTIVHFPCSTAGVREFPLFAIQLKLCEYIYGGTNNYWLFRSCWQIQNANKRGIVGGFVEITLTREKLFHILVSGRARLKYFYRYAFLSGIVINISQKKKNGMECFEWNFNAGCMSNVSNQVIENILLASLFH